MTTEQRKYKEYQRAVWFILRSKKWLIISGIILMALYGYTLVALYEFALSNSIEINQWIIIFALPMYGCPLLAGILMLVLAINIRKSRAPKPRTIAVVAYAFLINGIIALAVQLVTGWWFILSSWGIILATGQTINGNSFIGGSIMLILIIIMLISTIGSGIYIFRYKHVYNENFSKYKSRWQKIANNRQFVVFGVDRKKKTKNNRKKEYEDDYI